MPLTLVLQLGFLAYCFFFCSFSRCPKCSQCSGAERYVGNGYGTDDGGRVQADQLVP